MSVPKQSNTRREVQPVAQRIKELREKKGLSREELAKATFMSLESIICIEENIIQPAVTTLYKIARAMGVPAGIFIDGEHEENATPPIESAVNNTIATTTAIEITYEHFDYKSLVSSMGEKKMQPCIVTIPPKQEKSEVLTSYHAEAFLYLLRGKAIVTHGGKQHELAVGDSLYFDASVPHAINPKGRELIKLLIVLSPTE